MSWQESRCNAEGFGRPEPFFFLCEERTYSPPAKQAVVSLLRRVVRSARRMRLLREPPDNATSPAGAAVIICASGICPAFNAVQLSDACANLPAAALSQLWTELTVRPFSFSEKKQKQGYAKVRMIRSGLCKELHKGYELNSNPLKVKRT